MSWREEQCWPERWVLLQCCDGLLYVMMNSTSQ
jgi:hypothetical protein